MNNVQIVKPKVKIDCDFQSEKRTVKVSSLLTQDEITTVRKTGTQVIVCHKDRFVSAHIDSMVPKGSQILREKEGTLVGFAAVAGG